MDMDMYSSCEFHWEPTLVTNQHSPADTELCLVSSRQLTYMDMGPNEEKSGEVRRALFHLQNVRI